MQLRGPRHSRPRHVKLKLEPNAAEREESAVGMARIACVGYRFGLCFSRLPRLGEGNAVGDGAWRPRLPGGPTPRCGNQTCRLRTPSAQGTQRTSLARVYRFLRAINLLNQLSSVFHLLSLRLFLHSRLSASTFNSSSKPRTCRLPASPSNRNMPANVLFERDTNLPQAATTNSKPQGEKKPMSMEYHRQVLESRMKNGECVFQTSRSSGSDCSSSSRVQSLSNSHHHRQQQTYVSPSDNIQSPATQKLAAFKNKRLDKRYVCNLRPLLSLSAGIELI